MGATLSNIMQKSTKLKNRVLKPSTNTKVINSGGRGKQTALSCSPSRSKHPSQDTSSSCGSISHNHIQDTKAQSLVSSDIHVSIESGSEGASVKNKGAMDNWISRPSTSYASSERRPGSSEAGEPRYSAVAPRRPTTAEPKSRSSRMDVSDHTHSFHLHKCSSEPANQMPVEMRRTRSHNILPSNSSKRSSSDKKKPGMQYIEGSSVARGDQMSGKQQKHITPKAKQVTGDGEALSYNSSPGRGSQNSNSGSWITTSCSSNDMDAVAAATEERGKAELHLPVEDPSVDKLIRHMEYVATVLKKKMDPIVYNNNKLLFLARILSSQDIQYGYHSNKYIKIGSGEFGEVLYGRIKSTGQLIAIKALKKDKTDMFALLQEAFMLQVAGDTEFTPKYLGVVPFTILGDKFQEWAIVLEFVGNPQGPAPYDFRQTLKKAKSAPHTPQLLLEWIYTSAKIVHAVHQFHSKGMLINDIKADNILLRPVGNGYYPVFIDFGLASIGEGITLALEVNDGNRARILKEYSHIAPEVLFGGETNAASDMFSLGKALSLVADAFQVQHLTNIINQCTLWDVMSRPSIPELLNQFQWLSNAIVNRKL